MKKITDLKAEKRLEYLKNKELDRMKNPHEKIRFNLNIVFTKREIILIKRQTRYIKLHYGLSRTKVLRKVLLNLSDIDLLIFLGLYKVK